MNDNHAPLTRKLEILVFCVLPQTTAGTIGDHVNAFARYSRHHARILQNFVAVYGSFDRRLSTLPRGLDLDIFDVMVIHYSNFLPSDQHFDAAARERIAKFRGLKVLFLQDEYRQIDVITAHIRDLGIDVLFTCVPEAEIEKVYPASKLPKLTKVSNLTGYVPPGLARRKVRPLAQRPLDVGYRTRQVPFWLGELGAEKWQIAPKFLRATAGSGLRCDITYREEDRIYGKRWIRFIESCRSMLGTESGASVFDFTGELQQATERYVASHPGATFEDVHERFLKQHEGRVRLNQISPRCFEAAALRTALVLYEGEYSGILDPDRHYVPLRKDFSNIDEVVRKLRDTESLQAMVDRTYREIAVSGKYSYRIFIEKFDAVVEREILDRGILPSDGARRRTAPATHFVGAELGLSSLRFQMLHVLFRSRIRMEVLRIFVLRIVGGLLATAYRIYVRVLPESVRLKVRPYVRRIMFRDQA